MKKITIIVIMFCSCFVFLTAQDSTHVFKKRVLDNIELEFLSSYYTQDGDNAAVTGGVGTETLYDVVPTIVIKVPIGDDNVLSVEGSLSSYSSASSSNVDPFDGNGKADVFQASSGSSKKDALTSVKVGYSQYSDDRNTIWSGNLSFASEYDYLSIGGGASYTKLFNEKNTEISFNANAYIDTWDAIYPIELRPFAEGKLGVFDPFFIFKDITGNSDYAPRFSEFADEGRNSFSGGLSFSQILTKNIQGSIIVDVVHQNGLLSTPFQRVYFADVDDSFIDGFHLAESIERLPDTRTKVAAGARLNIYLNERFVLRGFYRYYEDNWNIQSHTASIEIPIKLSDKLSIYPVYRYYKQTAADYFAPYNEHLSTQDFYTSDYDLSEYTANQYGFGISYTDVFSDISLWRIGLKSIDLKVNSYERNSGLNAYLIALGFKFAFE